MSKNLQKVVCSLLTAAAFAAVTSAFCLFSAKPSVNASALIIFTSVEEKSGPVNTGVSRSISQMRKAMTHGSFPKEAAKASGMETEELLKVLSLERLEGSKGAQIILSGLDKPGEAPIILGNIIHLAKDREDIPSFEVISYCDFPCEPKFPVVPVSAAAGIAAGGAVFAAMSVQRRTKKPYRPEKASSEDGEYYNAVFVSDCVRQIYDNGKDLGVLMPSAPEGLEKGGYIAAAKKLLEKSDSSPIILAVSPARTDIEDIPYSARVCAYLACAFAALGKRTAAIECSLKNPSLGKIFGKCGAGGVSSIAAGTAAIWDAVVIDAREGVDIIAEKKSYPAPTAVFASSAYKGIIDYLSRQYEVIILNTPVAREEEWELIALTCTGITVASSDGRETDPKSAANLLKAPAEFISFCKGGSIEKTEPLNENIRNDRKGR